MQVTNRLTGRAGVLALELAAVAGATLAAATTAAELRIIPRALLGIPMVRFGAEDVRVMVVSTLVACLLTLLAARAIAGWRPFEGARRFAVEVYALVAGIVLASLYQFFLTAVNFSPEFLLQATLIAIAAFLLLFVVLGPRDRSAPARAGHGLGALFGLLNRPAAWGVVALTLTPLLVGRQFVADRDFANWVTRLRVDANVSADLPFTLANALGETRFTTPIMMQFAQSDPRTIYVLTRGGELWRADYPGGGDARLLMSIAPKVGFVEMENGALGFDLHPEFGRPGSPNAGFVYIYYTEYRKDGQTNHLTRYDLSAPTPEARVASATSLIEQDRGNDGYHNAGMVAFGPDGMLWLSVGEATMRECHQRVDCALVGGILRLDVDQRGGTVSRPIARRPANGRTANYMIPLDNPYANRADALGEFWAHGLRNPFRFAFDPADGTLWAGEVGSTTWEEVNRIEKGGNYQFPYVEGVTPWREARPAQLVGQERPPVLTYKHTAFLRSIIGGAVYRGDRHPALTGKYLFLDNYSGEVMALAADAAGPIVWEPTGPAERRRPAEAVVARARDVSQRGPTALVVAPDGEILVSIMGANDAPTGMIARLVPADSAAGRAAEEKARAEQRLAANAAKGAAVAGAVVAGVPLDQARALYNANCARCHGASGRGDGPDSQELGAWVPNFADANFHKWRSDEEILAAIRGGGAAVGQGEMMPPWEGILSDAEMAGVRDYVRSFRPAAGGAGKGG
jgi:glucose/arabinose dehydrogenase